MRENETDNILKLTTLWRCKHREQTYGQGRGEGEGGVNGDSSMETCILPYVK